MKRGEMKLLFVASEAYPLVKTGGLESPFDGGVLEKALLPVREWLSETDSSGF